MEKYESNLLFDQSESIDAKEILSDLKETEDKKERQKILDRFFNQVRREKMISDASEDASGRKVLYYRYMKWDSFLNLLKNKEQSAMNYHDKDVLADENEFKRFIISFFDLDEDDERKLDHLTVYDIIHTQLPDIDKDEIQKLKNKPNYQNIVTFIDKYFDKKRLFHAHTGSLYQKYSPYLSMSVGGIIRNYLKGNVYIECKISDDQINVNENSFQGEKEVLTKTIKLDNISRVYTDENKLIDELVCNPNSNIGRFAQKHNLTGALNTSEAIERWRWDEQTSDYLPVNLVNKLTNKK